MPLCWFCGGYIQDGGHSLLSSLYGLAFLCEVITADRGLITASREQNSDLYWALSGGGGGTFGVVWPATVRAYKDVAVAGAIRSFSTTDFTAYHSALYKGAVAYAFYEKG
ncbi:hypothetical protein L211DRAFT_867829 [Terfezia boudieri ATCC MYA-4762]|uniref:FAD-binding PCMH-type domain-containing protein n=1 Tax=Terfezia boudieri ATCC MYA-4762 TaxID=1051890 RepID=A0A3N4LSF5_9PEZI|nr:hypothetical protein L211DRAFT_867829 [Terfezia boudieri ATCC MYA-4762]